MNGGGCLEGDESVSLLTHLSINLQFSFVGKKDDLCEMMVDGWRLDVEGWKRF